ncbi:MAG: hypothetical protein DCC68_25085 [Planctomycetota bacterium]|nr:MAG: hypothetical protein DCC68_25085 [Planctomycetota bacterium]
MDFAAVHDPLATIHHPLLAIHRPSAISGAIRSSHAAFGRNRTALHAGARSCAHAAFVVAEIRLKDRRFASVNLSA